MSIVGNMGNVDYGIAPLPLTLNDIYISKQLEAFLISSSVATHLRCGGIFSDNVITNFLLILTVKEF